MEKCTELCIKKELGDDDNKKASWTMYFSRAPINSDSCIEACYHGCVNRVKEDDWLLWKDKEKLGKKAILVVNFLYLK